jgi:sodium/proline symporter
MPSLIILSFFGFLGLSTLVGLYSATRKRDTTSDYLLASRNVGPIATGLSAVASNNSGFMFIGLIGTTYMSGISASWLMIGWIFGDYLAWFFVHKKLRELSESRKTLTIPSFIGTGREKRSYPITALAGFITLIFLGTYAAAQLSAGSKALHVLFGWDYSVGAIMGATLCVFYCFAGGIRASIWTDVFQSCVMFFAMSSLFIISIAHIGGFSMLAEKLHGINPQLTQLFTEDLRFGFTLYLIGWLVAGLGVIGQPHIMIRFMAIQSSEEVPLARLVYFIWYTFFSACAIGIGLTCRVLIPEIADFDPELALPRLSMLILPQLFVGVVLAGLFSATMSTADSQILSCSAAITQDMFPWLGNRSFIINKVITVLVTALVLSIALFGSQNVFELVVLSWSGLAATLAPLICIRILHYKLPTTVGVLMMLTAFATILFWRYQLQLSGDLYEVLPGVIANFAVYAIYRLFSRLRFVKTS